MNKSVIMIVVVVVIAMTAGCAGVLDGGTTSEDDDGEGETGVATKDEASEAIDYPDGTGKSGLDASKLESRQETVLENRSYTVETHETIEYDTETYEESITLTVDGEQKMQKTKYDFTPLTEDSMFVSSTEKTWLFTETGNETLIRRTVDSNERYRVESGPGMRTTAEQNIRDELEAVLGVSGYELIDVEETDGSTAVTYEGTEMGDDLEQLYPLVDEYGEFAATVTVSDDGIERYAYEFEGETRNGNTESVAVETTFSGVGESELGRPGWVDEGFERAPEASISIDDGDPIALALESGEPIPENATVSLSSIGANYYGASVDEAFEPGETLYLTVRDDQLLATVDVEPDGAATIDTEWVMITVRTESGLVAYEGVYEK